MHNMPNYKEIQLMEFIQLMHEKFQITADKVPFSIEEKAFRIEALAEELNEYIEAETLEDELDALIDLIVFALGAIERQGMASIFNEAFTRVMHANLTKEVGPNQKRGSFSLDLVKPADFKSPTFNDLIEDLGEVNDTRYN